MDRILSLEGSRRNKMKRGFSVALVLAVSLAAAWQLAAQTPATGDAQKPATEATPSTSGTNSFPEDTSTVPVLPSAMTTQTPDGSTNGLDSGNYSLAGSDADPVHSPDDPATTASNGEEEESSSSLKSIEDLLPKADEKSDKTRKLKVKEPTHKEVASKDIEIGGYYLEKKNWKAALSRFQSAMVLDPENPEVYWGLAEAERHVGEMASARTHYLQLLDYDPDGPHGKQARKALKEPEIANGKNADPTTPAAEAAK